MPAPIFRFPGQADGTPRNQKVMVPQSRSAPKLKATNMATRHHHAARLAGVQSRPGAWYEILDPAHIPDLNGHFGGQKVQYHEGKQYVWMTEQQARFYLDGGALSLADFGGDQTDDNQPQGRRR